MMIIFPLGSVALLLLAILSLERVASFQSASFATKNRVQRSNPKRFELYAANTDTTRTKTTPTLSFGSKLSIQLDPVPGMPQEKVIEFLKIDENRNILMSGGGKNPIESADSSPKLIARWKELVEEEGGAQPDATDAFVSVNTGGIDFVGLKLKSQALIGSKLILDSTYPEFQFTLVGTENTAEGLPPLVWIYNKLTGAGKEGSESSQESTSFSRIVIMPKGDSKDLVIKADCSLFIGVYFPSILMKILPVSKEKAEEQGSAAVAKTVQKDLRASLELFREKLVDFASS